MGSQLTAIPRVPLSSIYCLLGGGDEMVTQRIIKGIVDVDGKMGSLGLDHEETRAGP